MRYSFCLLVFTTLLLSRAAAQEPAAARQAAHPTVTAAATADGGVRFVAPAGALRMRLEVFSAAGEKVFDTGAREGGVLNWATGEAAQGGADGRLLLVVTVEEMSGRSARRVVLADLSGGRATLVRAARAELSAAQAAAWDGARGREAESSGEASEEAVVIEGAAPALTVAAHDGRDGQLTSTAGALTFRTGDLFRGAEREHVRITPDGRVGVGTDRPEATLDVAGAVRARGGFKFPDGTTLTSKGGRLSLTSAEGDELPGPSAAGTGTENKLAKWAETGGAGTLTDSTLFEDASGNIGVGTTTPGGVFDLQRSSAADILQRFWNKGAGGAKLRYVSAVGATSQIQLTDETEWLMSIAGNNSAGMQFRVRAVGSTNTEAQLAASARMTILRNGNVGVGITAPTAKLHVVGAVSFTGLRTQENATSPNVVGGFSSNAVTTGVFGATISGGGGSVYPVDDQGSLDSTSFNRVFDAFGTVGGGGANVAGKNNGFTAGEAFATVGGGHDNIASDTSATVSGGGRNVASGNSSAIGGGHDNNASGLESAIGGGNGNAAAGHSATVAGGHSNTAGGHYSTVPGGRLNSAAGDYSFAAGNRAKAPNVGAFVWADSTEADFTSAGSNQFLIRAAGGVGINTNSTSAATLNVNGSGLFTGNLTVNGTLNATLPAGSANYIQSNPAAQQPGASFNISGNGTAGGTLTSGGLTVDINTLHVDAVNNRVGVGTTTPESPLHVLGTARASTLRASVNAGSAAAVTVGERYRDNALIGWGKVLGNGVVNANESFGITVTRDSDGVYTVTLLSAPTHQSVPVAVAEVDAAPTSAATARLVTIDQIDLTHFKVYITNGSFAAVDNDFTFVVTGR
ncbi:MAG: hypothetical protein LC795_11330 [Acidobacteria bacterium]|nr:hypothetical protein [Acidobacteriota bacterium]MCA1619883.1 hypothetical protein [Acidobacteriota bacterium]